jgi:hypothetical protein
VSNPFMKICKKTSKKIDQFAIRAFFNRKCIPAIKRAGYVSIQREVGSLT